MIDKKKRPKRAYNLKNNSVVSSGQSLYKAAVEFLSSIIDRDQVSYHLLPDDKNLPNIMMIYEGRGYFIEIINGRKKLPLAKADVFSSLERTGAKIVICRSTQALVLTIKHWNIPMVFDWGI